MRLIERIFGRARVGGGESEEHASAKRGLYEAFLRHPQCRDVRLERNLLDVRIDVSALVRGSKVAFEVQRSALPPTDLERRTLEYTRRGIAVVWLVPFSPEVVRAPYVPPAWVRWLHALGGGRAYYLVAGTSVRPVHFAPYRTRVEGRAWRASGGRLVEHDAYEHDARRARTPCPGPALDLLEDFRARRRDAWSGGTTQVPAALLFADREPTWWT